MFNHPASKLPRLATPILVLIVLAAVAALIAGAATASAASGGVGPGGSSSSGGDGDSRAAGGKYARLWERTSVADKRWARATSECESGGNPKAIGGGGAYRGAFQFMKSTWRSAPKSPGGDPISYDYKTQAVVAVALKNRDGAQHWPVCG